MSSTTIRGLNRDEWLTRDEIAGLMGRTEDTVRRLQRDNALRTRSRSAVVSGEAVPESGIHRPPLHQPFGLGDGADVLVRYVVEVAEQGVGG